jgi:hypothetical protein
MLIKYQQKAAELKDYAKKTANLRTVIDTAHYPVKISFYEQGKQISLFDTDKPADEKAARLPLQARYKCESTRRTKA